MHRVKQKSIFLVGRTWGDPRLEMVDVGVTRVPGHIQQVEFVVFNISGHPINLKIVHSHELTYHCMLG